MPSVVTAPHPFSEFDLFAIGSVLVVVMAILAFRRLMRPRKPSLDDDATGQSADWND